MLLPVLLVFFALRRAVRADGRFSPRAVPGAQPSEVETPPMARAPLKAVVAARSMRSAQEKKP